MSLGERAALEGVLAALSPSLAIEIGTAEGGSLRRIAAHSAEVHSFDLVEPDAETAKVAHATFHAGDSHALLPAFLAELAEAGRNVDFVLVDGDHSTEGVKADVEDLLSSPAIAQTTILLHDAANEVVRAGLDAVDLDAYRKVVHVDYDFVAGYVFREQSLRDEIWGGLGLILVDEANGRPEGRPARQQRIYETASILREHRDGRAPVAARVRARLAARLGGRTG
jgi:spermidine synthase